MARMVKKKREDYTQLAEFKAPWEIPGGGQVTLKVTVLVDLDELLDKQAPLVSINFRKQNKQTYGPFRVTLKEATEKG
jgi:hypothetical protein